MDDCSADRDGATTKQHWDAAWSGAFYAPGTSVGEQACAHRAAFVAGVLTKHEVIPRHVLDLGCGDGTFVGGVLARFPDARATLVDWSAEALRLARSRLGRVDREVDYILGDANACARYGSVGADVLLSMGVIEHFDSPGQIVKEMAHILPKAGVLVLMTPNSRSFVSVSRRILQARGAWTVGFQREYSVRRLRGFCADAGLHVLEASALQRPYILEDTPLTKFGAMVDRAVLRPLLPDSGWYSFVFARKDPS